jgi:predicted amidophosphoribosyltransferase
VDLLLLLSETDVLIRCVCDKCGLHQDHEKHYASREIRDAEHELDVTFSLVKNANTLEEKISALKGLSADSLWLQTVLLQHNN